MSNRSSIARAGLVLLGLLVAFVVYRPPLLDGVAFSRAIRDEHGKLLRLTLAPGDKYRLRTRLVDIPPVLIETTLLQEDQHFRRHFGVNVWSLARAAWQTFVARGRRLGASTLTMQVARVRYGIHSRSVLGKLRQIARALQLELHYSKDEILEAYFNLAPYGGNVEGAGAASLVYFGKKPTRLTLAEAMTLAVIPQSPAHRAPGLSAVEPARRELFARWREVHPEDASREHEITAKLPIASRGELPFLAPHFVTEIAAVTSAEEVVTTLDLGLQRLVERQIASYLESRRRAGFVNAVALAVDWTSMEVKALVGSADFNDERIDGQVNGARAKRSPGSTLKPFLYALAIDQGVVHPMTMLKDTPAYFADYDPENFDRDFAGPVKVKDALLRSRNVPAVQIANRLKPSLYSLLKDAGVTQLKPEGYYGLAVALGGSEMTAEELAGLYSMLANGGVLKPLRRTKDAPRAAEKRLLSPEAAHLVLDMLKDNPRPEQYFRREWLRGDLPVAWKTGTSFGFRDAWTAGVFGPYVLVVWIGNFDGASNPGLIGRDAAAPLFFRIVDAVKAARPLPADPFRAEGLNVKPVRVCSVSGELPGPFCRHTIPTLFIPGKSPIRTCAIHREIAIDPKTGKRACGIADNSARREIFEFWPSDLLKLFRQAGIPRRVPPPQETSCSLDARTASGAPPEITSPRREIEYSVRAGEIAKERIPLSAISDSDARSLYWFVDEKFVGKSAVQETFFWSPSPGRFVVRVVDDQGRSDAREIKVGVVE